MGDTGAGVIRSIGRVLIGALRSLFEGIVTVVGGGGGGWLRRLGVVERWRRIEGWWFRFRYWSFVGRARWPRVMQAIVRWLEVKEEGDVS